jgi:hypothetical protein
MSGDDNWFCGYRNVGNSSELGLVLLVLLPESLLFVFLLLLAELICSLFLFCSSNYGFLSLSIVGSTLFPLVCTMNSLKGSDCKSGRESSIYEVLALVFEGRPFKVRFLLAVCHDSNKCYKEVRKCEKEWN